MSCDMGRYARWRYKWAGVLVSHVTPGGIRGRGLGAVDPANV